MELIHLISDEHLHPSTIVVKNWSKSLPEQLHNQLISTLTQIRKPLFRLLAIAPRQQSKNLHTVLSFRNTICQMSSVTVTK